MLTSCKLGQTPGSIPCHQLSGTVLGHPKNGISCELMRCVLSWV